MSLQAIYEAANSGLWETLNPYECGCRGSGWFLSDVDTWHKCHTHNPKASHPEDEGEHVGNTVKQEARNAYKVYGNLSGMAPHAFNTRVKKLMGSQFLKATPENFLWAAGQVFEDHQSATWEAREGLAYYH